MLLQQCLLDFFPDLIPPYQPDPLIRVWLYFCDVLCSKQVPAHVTNVYNMEFAQLPWEQLKPNTQVLNTMMQVTLFSNCIIKQNEKIKCTVG